MEIRDGAYLNILVDGGCHPNCWAVREGKGVERARKGRKVLVFFAVYKILGPGAWVPFCFCKFDLDNTPSR